MKKIPSEVEEQVVAKYISKVARSVPLLEFLKKNYLLFKSSGDSVKEIYMFLKNEQLDVGNYSTFRRLYKKVEELNARCSAKSEQIETPGLPVMSKSETAPGTKKETGSTEKGGGDTTGDATKYISNRRYELEVPFDELEEALKIGAIEEKEFGQKTGEIFVPGKSDLRPFAKWLEQHVCERYGLKYRQKDGMVLIERKKKDDEI